MEFSISTRSMDDAEDIFLLAKERLLDVNDWNVINRFILTDSHKHKVHRNVHAGDFIMRSNDANEWYVVNKIQYDDYPDIAGESLTIFLSNANNPETLHSIAVNRVGKLLTVQGHDLDFTGDASNFLKGLIYTDEYAIAS
jgi:hypothetical protein